MRTTRIKAAKHIHEQKKSGTLPSGAVRYAADVDLTNIKDGEFYYDSCAYVSSFAETYAKEGLMTAYADASHMEGKGSNTFGTYFDVGTYTSNHSLCSIVSGHGIGPECKEGWSLRFEATAAVVGFDVPGRTTVVDLEKAIDTAHDAAMHNGARSSTTSASCSKTWSPRLAPTRMRQVLGLTLARSGRRRSWRWT
jgi:hypothetical protein